MGHRRRRSSSVGSTSSDAGTNATATPPPAKKARKLTPLEKDQELVADLQASHPELITDALIYGSSFSRLRFLMVSYYLLAYQRKEYEAEGASVCYAHYNLDKTIILPATETAACKYKFVCKEYVRLISPAFDVFIRFQKAEPNHHASSLRKRYHQSTQPCSRL